MEYAQKRKRYDRIIGHALTHIPAIQVASFMALLYNLVTFAQIVDNSVPDRAMSQSQKDKFIPPNNPDLNYNFLQCYYSDIDLNSEKYKDLQQLIFDRNDKFIHKLVYFDKTTIIEYYPGIKAPPTTIELWIKRLHLHTIASLNEVYNKIGNYSVQEVRAEMIGLYSFYAIQRYTKFMSNLLYISSIFFQQNAFIK